VFLDPQFPIGRGNSGNLQTFKAKLEYLCLHGFSGPFGPKVAVFCEGCDDDPPMNSFLLLGVIASNPLSAKIDQETRPSECRQTDRQIDTL